MKKTLFLVVAIIMMAATFVSCGSKSESSSSSKSKSSDDSTIAVKPFQKTIKLDVYTDDSWTDHASLKDIVEFSEDGKLKVDFDRVYYEDEDVYKVWAKYKFVVTVRLVKPLKQFYSFNGIEGKYRPDVKINDKNHSSILGNLSSLDLDEESMIAFVELLENGKAGDTVILTFSGKDIGVSQEDVEKKIEQKGLNFMITMNFAVKLSESKKLAEGSVEEEAMPDNATAEADEIPEAKPVADTKPVRTSSGKGLYPEGSTRRLTEKDIAGMSSKELKIMRNEIYARHGYIFTTADMKAYFSRQPWYTPIAKNVTLTAIEQANVAFIKAHE